MYSMFLVSLLVYIHHIVYEYIYVCIYAMLFCVYVHCNMFVVSLLVYTVNMNSCSAVDSEW